MAAKKTATKKSTGTGTTRKAAAARATKATAGTSPKAGAATKTKAASAGKTAAKKPLKLSDAQAEALRKIDSAGEAGYVPSQKTELRSIEKLRELKLAKRGAKDKVTGNHPYMTTAAGKKHLASAGS